jgi:Zn-dependent peptidase ImmA (M78 family)
MTRRVKVNAENEGRVVRRCGQRRGAIKFRSRSRAIQYTCRNSQSHQALLKGATKSRRIMPTVYDGMTIPDIRKAARDNADGVLETYWDGRLPVDPIRIARAMGVEVYTAQLGADVYGMITGTPADTEIFLDIDQAPVRSRFTCAHELGHYVERSSRLTDDNDAEFAEIDRRSDKDHGKPIEVFANEFAGSLLMPQKEVHRLYAQQMTVFEMARIFNVSVQAMSFRKFHLGLE